MNYKHTVYACFTGYIVQAVVNNFVPLLFLTFQASYGIPLSKITFLITVNFGIQLLVDLASAVFVDKIGYRTSVVLAHIFAGAGLLGLTALPELFPDPYWGLLLSVVIYAIGGGLIEVLISPIMESCPTENKKSAMSLLHSFYCWGHVGVVLFSTIFFAAFGIQAWKYMTILWVLIPAVNTILFSKVPLSHPQEEAVEKTDIRKLLSKKIFWVMMLLMMSAGASEQSVSQWASTLAEKGIGVSKAIGDLAGPMLFATCMGISRLFYGKYGKNIDLERFMAVSGIVCIGGYLLVGLSGLPVLGFIGCGICGMAVGIMWPGTFSIAAEAMRGGGTAMFAFLALAGDVGCSIGPTVTGIASSMFSDDLKKGILFAVIFPVILIVALLRYHASKKSSARVTLS